PGLGEGHPAAASGRLEIGDRRLRLVMEEASFDGERVGGTIEAAFADSVRIGGELRLRSASLPVLVGFAIGGVPAAEDGGWGDTPFAAAVPSDVALDFGLSADRLDLGLPLSAEQARLSFSLADD